MDQDPIVLGTEQIQKKKTAPPVSKSLHSSSSDQEQPATLSLYSAEHKEALILVGTSGC